MAEAASVSLFGGATGRERRANQRKSLLDVSLITVDLTPGAYGLMLDISETGARVQAMGSVEPGRNVQIAFHVPALSKRIEGIGSIKWSDEDGRVGVRFESLTNASTEELRHWINSLPQAAEVTTRDVEPPPPELNFSDYVTEIPTELQSNASDADSVLQFLVEKVVERTHANGSAIAIGTPDNMVCRASAGVAPEVGTTISSESALSSECLRTGRIVKCDDTESDPRVNPEISRQLNLRSLLIVPVKTGGQVHGLLEVFSPVANSFDAQHVTLLEELAHYASEVLFPSESASTSTEAVVLEEAPSLSLESIASLASSSEEFLEEPVIEKKSSEERPFEPPTTSSTVSETTFTKSSSFSTAAAAAPAPVRETPVKTARSPRPATRRERSAAAAVHSPATPARVQTEPETAPQTNRSIIAVAIVVVLLLVLSGVGWWYGVRVSKKTPPAAAPTTAQAPAPATSQPVQQQESPTTTPAAATATSRPKSTSRTEQPQETADDVIRSNGQERRVQTNPLVIAPADRPTRRNDEGSIVAPSLSNVGSNQAVANLTLPAYTATPALRAPSTISGGQLLQRVEPTYPSFARQQRYQGDVVLSIHINKNGGVENVRRISGNPMLSAAAVDAVKKWRYEPYKLNGQPQEIDTTVTIKFKLPN
jgi:TonB family protein